MHKLTRRIPWHSWLYADGLIILLHLLFGGPNIWFNLDHEHNLPTWYQVAKLAILGLTTLALVGWHRHQLSTATSFLAPCGLIMLFISTDELWQFHENIYRVFEHIEWFHPSRVVSHSQTIGFRSSLWLLYYMPFFLLGILWLGYWLRYFQENLKKAFSGLILVSGLFLLVIVAELLSSTGVFSQHDYFWLVTLEESAELIGASVLGLSVMNVAHHELNSGSKKA